MTTDKALTSQETAVVPRTMHEVFVEMARDSTIDVTRIGALMELQFKADARESERLFNQALERAIAGMPRIRKDKKNDGVGWRYSSIDEIDRVARPIYEAEGFTLSYRSDVSPDGKNLRIGILKHVAGHQEISRRIVGTDKGPGRNDIQAEGSAESYADRRILRGFFNIISENEDDDGKAASGMTQQQKDSIDDLLNELGPTALEPFLKFQGVKAKSDLQRSQYVSSINYLQAKRKQMGAK